MKERPILMSAPMIRAILSGTKTQTRRISNPHQKGGRRYFNTDGSPRTDCIYPYGAHGDLLWVREAFRFPDSFNGDSPKTVGDRCLIAGYPKPWAPTHYEADGWRDNWMNVGTSPGSVTAGKLRPGIHMPRWASRITLEIVSVRVERLQDISEEDAIAEGVYCESEDEISFNGPWYINAGDSQGYATAKSCYEALWDSINGEGSWEKNPWVWVIEFRRILP